jgi:hypothetical protein
VFAERAGTVAESGDAAKRLLDADQRARPMFGAKRPSAMVALRVATAGAVAPQAKPGETILEVALRDPRTGAPLTSDAVVDGLLGLLQGVLPRRDGGALQAIATEPREVYDVMTYDEAAGRLALRRVAAGDESTVTVSADAVRAAVSPGETPLGGLHNHPGEQRACAYQEDLGAHATLSARLANYVDVIIAGPTVSATRVRDAGAVGDGETVTFHAWNVNQMNRDPDEPKTVERVDRADVDVPNAQNHVHFGRTRASRNEDGTWGHGGATDADLMREEKAWLESRRARGARRARLAHARRAGHDRLSRGPRRRRTRRARGLGDGLDRAARPGDARRTAGRVAALHRGRAGGARRGHRATGAVLHRCGRAPRAPAPRGTAPRRAATAARAVAGRGRRVPSHAGRRRLGPDEHDRATGRARAMTASSRCSERVDLTKKAQRPFNRATSSACAVTWCTHPAV